MTVRRLVIPPRRWGKRHAYEQGLMLLRALGYEVTETVGKRGAVVALVRRPNDQP